MKNLNFHSDDELLTDLKSGNLKAFDTLYEKFSKRLYRFSYSLLKSKEEAENILQETFMKLWEKRLIIKKGSSLEYYIFTIAHNAIINRLREKIKENMFIEHLRTIQVFQEDSNDIMMEPGDIDKKIHEIIDQLPIRQREVFIMHSMDGLKYREIAERLNISVNTIENHMSNAYKTIRTKLSEYYSALLIIMALGSVLPPNPPI